MRILYVFPENLNRVGGGTVHFLGLARGLLQLGHDITIMAPQYFRTIRRFPDLRSLFLPLPGRNVFSFILFQLLGALLFPVIWLIHRPQAVIIRGGLSLFHPMCWIAKAFGARVVLELNGIVWAEMESRGFPPIMVRLVRWSTLGQCRAAHEVIGVTEAIAEEAARASGIAPDRTHAIANGASPEEFDRSCREEARRALKLNDQNLVVMLVSLFTPWHGIMETISSAKHLPEDVREHVRYLIVGDGALWKQARQYVQRENLESTVLLPGWASRQEVKKYMAASDVGVFFTTDPGKKRFPGSPLKFFEYLAASLPVLVTDDSHLTPRVQGDGLGLVIPDAAPQTIADAVADIYRRREEFAEIGQRNRTLAETKYSWYATAQQVAQVLAGDRPSSVKEHKEKRCP